MSRYYGMSVEIKGYDPKRSAEIQEAAGQEWNWDDDWYENKRPKEVPAMTCYGESNLCGGESEEEFARRLKLAIWKANQAYCDICVCATYMEELPYESYCGDEDEYEKAKAAGLLEEEKEDDEDEEDA